MPYDTENVFARIIRGEAPCHKVYEDEETLAFMDIMPQIDGHTLVVPKEFAETIFELSSDAMAACARTTKRVAAAVRQAFDSQGIVIVQQNGAQMGQTVPHVHFHLLPGSIGTIIKRPHAAILEDPEKLAEYAARIIAALQFPRA